MKSSQNPYIFLVMTLSIFGGILEGSALLAESAPVGKELQTLEFRLKTRQERLGSVLGNSMSATDLLASRFDKWWRRLREHGLDGFAKNKIFQWSGVFWRGAVENSINQLKSWYDDLWRRARKGFFIGPPEALPVEEI